MTTNQTMRTGPNTIPMPDVPLNWMANSAVRSPIVIGMTVWPNAGVATCSPSTADSTLIAGVMMPSPNSSPAPSISDHSSNVVPRLLALGQKAVEREHAALAVVLRAQDEDGVFDGDDDA